MPDPVVESIVENSVLLFKQKLGWKAGFIDETDVQMYRDEVRRAIQEALARKGVR
jgi:hypothetical protein